MKLGSTARDLRVDFGLTQRATAARLGISFVHLSNIENGHAHPSADLLDKFQELFGVDLYVYAWCKAGNTQELPGGLRDVSRRLTAEWSKLIERRKESFREED